MAEHTGLLAPRPRSRPSSLSPPLPPFLSPLFLPFSPFFRPPSLCALLGAEGSREGEGGVGVNFFVWPRPEPVASGGERGDPGAAEPWMARRGALDSAKSGGRGRSETGRGAPGAGWGLARPAVAGPVGPGRPRSPRRPARTRKTMGSPRPPPRPGPDPRGGSGESPPRLKRTSLMDLP